MDTPVVIAIVVVAVIVVVAAVLAARAAARRRASSGLQERFGEEYGREVERSGGQREAEAALAERERRHDKLQIHPLSAADRERYASAWRRTQEGFVEAPSAAAREADLLVTQVMRDRGYPMDDFDQRSADVSVEHPEVVENYRAAHRIADANDRGEATTEHLREALLHYRTLFESLLGPADDAPSEGTRT